MVIANLARNSSSNDFLSRAFTVLYQQLRYANRPNLQRPRPLHFNRARMLTVCLPVYPPRLKNCAKDASLPTKPDNPITENPYGVFLAGQMRRDMAAHPLVAVLHHNSYTQHEMINIKGSFYDMNYQVKIRERINHSVSRLAFTGTRWSPLIHLLKSTSTMMYCSSDSIPDLQKALKKMPQFVLLAVVVHDRILSKDEVEQLAKLRDITNVRAQFTSTLSLQSVTLSQSLTANISALSHSLNTYATGAGEDTSSSSSSDSDSDSDSSSSDSDKEK